MNTHYDQKLKLYVARKEVNIDGIKVPMERWAKTKEEAEKDLTEVLYKIEKELNYLQAENALRDTSGIVDEFCRNNGGQPVGDPTAFSIKDVDFRLTKDWETEHQEFNEHKAILNEIKKANEAIKEVLQKLRKLTK